MATHSSIFALRIPWTENPSPWSCKELGTTEQLTQTALCFCCLQAAYLLYKDVFMYFLNLVTAFMFKNVKDL